MPTAAKHSTITKETAYPFGMLVRSYSDSIYRFGFNGKERDDEILGNGRWQDYGQRLYRPDLIRFFTPDPLIVYQKKYPELSSYQFASNTPIMAIDMDGLEKYEIYMRTFAPWRFFGGGYEGDNRGFTTMTNDENITSRIWYKATIDTDKKQIVASDVGSDPSRGRLYWIIGDMKTARSNSKERTSSVYSIGETQTFSASLWGANPLFPGAPDIDWHGTFSFDESKISEGVLKVTITIRGDGFPAFETFIKDENGNSVFLAGFAPSSKRDLGNLYGNDTYMKVSLDILVDEKGNFKGVRGLDGKEYSLEEWNSFFENQAPAGDCEGDECGN